MVHNSEPCWFHGTDDASARSIVEDGLDTAKREIYSLGIFDDKGLSLLDEEHLAEVRQWAEWRALERGGDPAIVAIDKSLVEDLLGTEGWRDAHEVFIDACHFHLVKPGMFRIIPW